MAIQAAFERHTNDTTVIAECQDIECLRKQDARQGGYYIIPEILHREERATEWSGKPDRIEVKISVYDASNLQELASVIISGKSKWATFGGDHPQDLLPEPIGHYVDSLYQGQF